MSKATLVIMAAGIEVVLEAESSSWLQSDQMERLSWTTPSMMH